MIGRGREMDGVHDLGGMHGFGPVAYDPRERGFHAPWEAVVVAIMRAGRAHALFNIDEFRHAIERMPPARYLGEGYFERWLDGMTRLFLEKGVVTEDELDGRTRAAAAGRGLAAPLGAGSTGTPAPAPGPPERWPPIREATRPPRFAPGDAVVTLAEHPAGHTRLPRYARGKRGTIDRRHGVHVFADAHAHGLGEDPQPLYSVRFEARELWAGAAERDAVVYLDLWESYLQPGV